MAVSDGSRPRRRIRLQDLRGTFVTRLIRAGADIKTVQALARHANASTTLNMYAQDELEGKREGIARLSDALSGTSADAMKGPQGSSTIASGVGHSKFCKVDRDAARRTEQAYLGERGGDEASIKAAIAEGVRTQVDSPLQPSEPYFRFADEVKAIAKELIAQHHHHLRRAKVIYLFASKPKKIHGKAALGTASVISGRNAFLCDNKPESFNSRKMATPSFVIEIWESAWMELSHDQRRALVDHQLCHCRITCDDDGIEKYAMRRGHDLEEFNAVVERHGHWQEDIDEFVRAAETGQPRLDLTVAS